MASTEPCALERSVTRRSDFLEKIGLGDLASGGAHRMTAPADVGFPQFRFNIVTGVWCLAAASPDSYNEKPRDYVASAERDDPTHLRPEVFEGFDPFALANQDKTPPEKTCVMDPLNKDKKLIRVFDNKFPVLDCTNKPTVAAFDLDVHPIVLASGVSEVIVQHWKFGTCQALMTPEECGLLWKVIQERARRVPEENPGVRYVQCFENHGIKSGGSLRHPHAQVNGLPFVPSDQIMRLQLAKTFYNENNSKNIFDEVLEHLKESNLPGDRVLFENDVCVAFVPWAPERSYEFWVVPRRPCAAFSNEAEDVVLGVAVAVSHCLRLLYLLKDDPDYNIMVRTLPVSETSDPEAHRWYRWHVSVVPSVHQWTGILSLGGFPAYANPPEDMARQLREQKGKDLPPAPEAPA